MDGARRDRYHRLGQWTDDTLLDRWDRSVAAYGDREFISDDQGGRYTYREMDQLAGRTAAVLRRYSIGAGDVVTFQITPRCAFAAVTLACFKLGAVAVPLGMCFEQKELNALLAFLDSRLHLSMAYYRDKERVSMLKGATAGLPLLNGTILVGGSCPGEDSSFPLLESLWQEALSPPPCHRGHGDDLAVILCTSGTSGATRGSKAVMFTHNNIIFSEDGFNRELGLTEEDAIFMPAPLNHATGFHHGLISPMLRGGRVVLQERFHCAQAVRQMNDERCTYSMGATPFIYDLVARLDESGEELPWLRFYVSGGAPLPEELVKRAYQNHNILVCECYGSTESVPHVFVRPKDALQVMGRWAGQTMDGVEVRIVDKDHNPVPPNVIGEEASRGPNVFVGYWKRPDLTRQALDDQGWYYSGDLCIMDEAGNIKVVGRKKDIIIRGGENLNTNEINDELEGCPGVTDHAVIGMPDSRLGERICAFVVCRPQAPAPTKDSVIAYLKAKHVPKRHWPERLERIDAIPRTDSGKVKKHLLAQELERRMAAGEEGV